VCACSVAAARWSSGRAGVCGRAGVAACALVCACMRARTGVGSEQAGCVASQALVVAQAMPLPGNCVPGAGA